MNKEWKIYTKTGDKGETSLIGGQRVKKNHHRIEAYGTVDELNAFVAAVRDADTIEFSRNALLKIQERLFSLESRLAAPDEAQLQQLPEIKEEDILFLEKEIDTMNEKLSPLSNFILPGGHPLVSAAHIARTVCRRAERTLISLNEKETIEEILIRYLNRLSDYLFVLARFYAFSLQAPEIIWKPEK